MVSMHKRFSYCGIIIKVAIEEDNLVSGVEFERGASRAPEISYEELLHYKLNLSYFSAFGRAVLEKTREIPSGNVATYGEIARAVGKPEAARAVGSVMAKNPFPVLVPCHRVIKCDLSLGEYSGGGARVKRKLLESEGIEFNGKKVKREFVHRF